jgi:hypothetical protein
LNGSIAAPIGYEWFESSRANRIGERLAADNRHSLAASCSIQTDLVSIPARRLLRARFDVTGLPDSAAFFKDWNDAPTRTAQPPRCSIFGPRRFVCSPERRPAL